MLLIDVGKCYRLLHSILPRAPLLHDKTSARRSNITAGSGVDSPHAYVACNHLGSLDVFLTWGIRALISDTLHYSCQSDTPTPNPLGLTLRSKMIKEALRASCYRHNNNQYSRADCNQA